MASRADVITLLLCLAASGAGAADEALMPLSEVRAGMQGVGRTVFEGARVDPFGVRILGVLENALGPRQSVILARLEGGPLAETGVIAGMSGSPVFVNDRLVGAVAYAFPFGKQPIAGITPISEMIEATRAEAPRSASARLPASLAARGLRAPLDRAAVTAAFKQGLSLVAAGALSPPAQPSAAALRPVALPLAFSGFEPDSFEWARGLFAGAGFAPMLSGGPASSIGSLPGLSPGSAVGISLIEGDLDLSATGTLTHIDNDRVYAFGHPFYNLGPTQFPLKKAWVYSVFPSLQVSWKIAAATDVVGTMDQDRSTAIAGRLGAPPRMIPVEVHLRSTRAPERVFRYRMVDDELLTPVLAYVSLLSVLQGHERAFGASTLRLKGRLGLGAGRSLAVEEVAAADRPAEQAAAALAGPLALVIANEFERVAIEGLELTVEAEEVRRTVEIERVWIDSPQPLRPGTQTAVRVELRAHRGELLEHSLPFVVPPDAAPGSYILLVADARTFDGLEQRELRQPFAPRDLPQLLRALAKLRSGHRLYARLTRLGTGALVSGEYLPALPGSVLSVLSSPVQGANAVAMAPASVWKAELPTDHAVSGARQLAVTIVR